MGAWGHHGTVGCERSKEVDFKCRCEFEKGAKKKCCVQQRGTGKCRFFLVEGVHRCHEIVV